MLCADALAASKTSLNFLTSAHSRANVYFFPTPCGEGLFKRMQNPPVKASLQNTTLLLLEKPGAEVRGEDVLRVGNIVDELSYGGQRKGSFFPLVSIGGVRQRTPGPISKAPLLHDEEGADQTLRFGNLTVRRPRSTTHGLPMLEKSNIELNARCNTCFESLK